MSESAGSESAVGGWMGERQPLRGAGRAVLCTLCTLQPPATWAWGPGTGQGVAAGGWAESLELWFRAGGRGWAGSLMVRLLRFWGQTPESVSHPAQRL